MRSLIGSIVNRSPVPLSSRRTGGGFNLFSRAITSGQDEQYLRTMGSVGTVFAIVSKLCTAVAKTDWTLYSKSKSGLKEDRTPFAGKHAMIDLWNKPNPFMNRRRFVEYAQQHVELVGENDLVLSLVDLGRLGKVPTEMWPVRPDRIQVVPDPYDFIAGYVYTSPDGLPMPLGTDELLRIMLPNPVDPYRGMGPAQSIIVDTQNARNAAEWNRAFFENSAEPGGVIQVPISLNDQEFDRLASQWDQDHKGVRKAHRVAILESDAKWVSTSFTHRDMQFAELGVLSRDKILEAWGMSKFMIGVVDDVNRAQAEAAEYVFAKWMVEERLDRWRDMLNLELLPMYGRTSENLEWDYESPVPQNSEADNAAITAKSTAAVALAGAGFEVPGVLDYLGLPALAYSKPEPKVISAPPGARPGSEDNA